MCRSGAQSACEPTTAHSMACGRRCKGETYKDLAEKPSGLGTKETEANLRNKVSRGSFTAGLIIQCLTAIGATTVRLEGWQAEQKHALAPAGCSCQEGRSMYQPRRPVKNSVKRPHGEGEGAHEPEHPYERPMFIVTAVGVAVVAISTGVAAWQAWVANTQLGVSIRDQRPWVSAKKITVDGSGTARMVRFVLQNTGRSPNEGTGIDFKIVPGGQWKTAQPETCNNRARGNAMPRDWDVDGQFSIVPGQDFYADKDAPRAVESQVPAPHIVGCITYRWHGTNYRTGFVGPLVKQPDRSLIADHLWTLKPN